MLVGNIDRLCFAKIINFYLNSEYSCKSICLICIEVDNFVALLCFNTIINLLMIYKKRPIGL